MHRTASFRSLCAARLAQVFETIRAGSWLTPERLRVYPAMIGAMLLLGLVGLVATAQGAMDRWHRPLGVDFSGIWVAGRAVLAGHALQPYDNAAHAAAQAAAFGASATYLPWSYPPYGLAIAAALASLPYLAALTVWQGTTLLLYLAAVLRASRGTGLAGRDGLLAALAFPAVAINLCHGQNGFLSAGLLGLGGMMVSRRPLLAGLLLGLLATKPQFMLVVPVALVAGGYWRAAAMMAATVSVMTFATLVGFGTAPWCAFFTDLSFARHVILEDGGLPSYKLQSAFAAVRLLAGSVGLAYVAQAVVTLAALASVASLWRRATDPRLKVAALILATFLSTPYAVDYDMTMIGPAIALMIAHGFDRGFAPYMKTLLACAWLAPLGARVVAMTAGVPLGFITTASLFCALILATRPKSEASCQGARKYFRGRRVFDATVSNLPR